MPKQLNNGRVTAALQRAFDFKGRYIPMLDEVIVPVYAIEDPTPAAPQLTYASVVVVPGGPGVGDFAFAKIKNLEKSGGDFVLTEATVGSFVDDAVGPPTNNVIAVEVRIALSLGSTFPTIHPSVARDSRNNIPSKSEISSGSATAVADGLGALAFPLVITDQVSAQIVSSGISPDRQPAVVLKPGTALSFLAAGKNAEGTAGTPGAPMLISLNWFERPIGILDQL